MRKFQLLALAFVIGTASVFAVNPNPTPKKVIRSQIVDLLTTPEFDVNTTMTVHVTFTFNSDGQIVVLKVDSRNKDVLNYLRTHLNYQKVDNPGEKDKIYSMDLKIKEA